MELTAEERKEAIEQWKARNPHEEEPSEAEIKIMADMIKEARENERS